MSNPNKFFCETGDGIVFYQTAQEAQDAAETALAKWRSVANADGEWPEEAELVFWGKICGMSVPRVSCADDLIVDFRIEEVIE